jgi:hypothetical protein
MYQLVHFSRTEYIVHGFQCANVHFWESVPIHSLSLKCSNWYTFPKITKISTIYVTFLVEYLSILHRIKFCSIVFHAKHSLLPLQEAVPLPLVLSSYAKSTHNTQPLPISSPPPPPPPPSYSTTMMDIYHYKTNIIVVCPVGKNNKLTDLFDAETRW